MPRDVHERQDKLIALLEERGQAALPDLVSELGASEATLRRDLINLEKAGKLTRTFGGARLAEPHGLVAKTFGEKREEMRAEKQQIARAVAQLVEPGMVVALDSGTTIWCVATTLRDKAPLTILTCALAAVEELGSVPGMTIHLLGGRFRLENLDFVGPTPVAGFERLHADIGIVSADSFVPGRGAFAIDEPSASVASAIATCADRLVIALDHTKFGARACCRIAPSEDIDYLVTDSGIDSRTRQQIETEPFRLVVAG